MDAECFEATQIALFCIGPEQHHEEVAVGDRERRPEQVVGSLELCRYQGKAIQQPQVCAVTVLLAGTCPEQWTEALMQFSGNEIQPFHCSIELDGSIRRGQLPRWNLISDGLKNGGPFRQKIPSTELQYGH